jgi:hypothetical protein
VELCQYLILRLSRIVGRFSSVIERILRFLIYVTLISCSITFSCYVEVLRISLFVCLLFLFIPIDLIGGVVRLKAGTGPS